MAEKALLKKNFRSLTVTLAIAFLALSMVILLIVTSLNVYFNLQSQQKVIADQQQLISQRAANEVKIFIQERFRVLEAAVKVGNISNVVEGEQKLVLEKLIGLDPAFRQLLLLNVDGEEVIKSSRLSSFVVNRLMELMEDDMFFAVSRGEMHISSIYIDEVTSEPLVIMAVPITNVFGEFEGALMAEVNLKFMWDLMDQIQVGAEGVAYVVDKKGDLIAFEDISRVLRGENLFHLEEVAEFVRGDKSVHKSSSDISTGIQGGEVVAGHAHLEKPDWAVVVELPVSEAYASVFMQVRLSALAMILSFLLAILVGIYLSKKITKPIINLRNAAIKIGEGGMDTQIDIKTNDEIGDLASAFTQMTVYLKKSKDQLEEYSKNLENKVHERTQELEDKNNQLERFNNIAVGRELKMIELKKTIKKFKNRLGEGVE